MARFQFGDFEFDSAAGRLDAHGSTKTLRPKSARLLAMLLANRGRVVTREEIQAELWNGSTVSFDNSIEACVRDVRKSLGDSAAEPVFIRTHPRKGYEFIAAAEELTPEPPVDFKQRTAVRLTAGLTAALVLAGVFLFLRPSIGPRDEPGAQTAGELEGTPLVAVLPSRRAPSLSATQTAHASEIAIIELTRYAPQLLRVLSIESAAALREQSPVKPERLSGLGVTHVLWVTPDAGGSGRFKVELADLSDNSALLSAQFQTDDASANALALDIARVLSKTREIKTTDASLAGDVFRISSPLAPANARRDFFLGRNAYFQGDTSRAVEYFESALRTAPDSSAILSAYAYTLAHAGDEASAKKASTAAIRAIELNAANAEALVVLGNLSVADGDLEKAYAYFADAREIAPGMAQLRHGLAAYHVLTDEYDLALKEIALAEELDPLAAPVIGDSAWFFLLAGRFEESLARCAQLESILGAHIRVAQCKFNVHFESGNYSAAADIIPELMALLGAQEHEIANVQSKPARATLNNYWRWRLTRLDSTAEWRPDAYAAAGRFYAALGEDEKSVDAFEEALSMGSRAAPFILRLRSLQQLRQRIAIGRAA